jgi:organic hydroperoxide reductase OsmC/OhrA
MAFEGLRTATMEIAAIVRNAAGAHEVSVRTDGRSQPVAIAARSEGQGSAVNGGELLMLALATCYCNDLYREAARMNVSVQAVEVEATAEFPGIGLAARNIRYRAKVSSTADASVVAELLRQTDVVAEVHNTLRNGASVEMLP